MDVLRIETEIGEIRDDLNVSHDLQLSSKVHLLSCDSIIPLLYSDETLNDFNTSLRLRIPNLISHLETTASTR